MRDKYESVSLDEWVYSHYNIDDMKSVFLNMDRALKYIHEHGYCVEVFYPSEVQVINDNDECILFNRLMKLPDDYQLQKKIIQEDIFLSSLLQIGFYSIQDQYYMNSMKSLNPEFLKEHFEEFTQFLPMDVVPYYRGVILRDASVYLCEYSLEKRNRDLQELENMTGEVKDEKPYIKEKINLTNDSINNILYSQIIGKKYGAYINLWLIPTIILSTLFLLGLLSWIVGV